MCLQEAVNRGLNTLFSGDIVVWIISCEAAPPESVIEYHDLKTGMIRDL